MYLSFEILLGLILVIANSDFDVLLIYAQKTLVQYGTRRPILPTVGFNPFSQSSSIFKDQLCQI